MKKNGGETFALDPVVDEDKGVASFVVGRITKGGSTGDGKLAEIEFRSLKAIAWVLVTN